MEECSIFAIFVFFALLIVSPVKTLNVNHLEDQKLAEKTNNDDDVPIRYDGDQLWNIQISKNRSNEILNLIQGFNDGTEIWRAVDSNVHLFVKKKDIDKLRIALTDNYQYEVLIEDIQKVIEKSTSNSEYSLDNFWSNYQRLDSIFSFLDEIVSKYPDLCSLQTIGQTFENRPLKVLKISGGGNKTVWIDGGIHAREWISSASVTYIINELVSNWANHPAYIRNINWYILPAHNPDGYEYSHQKNRMWRKNRINRGETCIGVDLNRNFGYKWGYTGNSPSCSETHGGPNAFSENESKAVQQFFKQNSNENFQAYLTFHSYGQYILYPWGYDNILTEDSEDLDRVGKEAAVNMKSIGNEIYRVGNSAITLYPAAGASDDWGKSIGCKYSYTIELRDKGKYGFILPPEFIVPTANEALQFVFTIAKAI